MEKNIPAYQCPLCGRDMKCVDGVGLWKEWHVYCNKCHAGVLVDDLQSLVENMPELLTHINPYITRVEFRKGKIQLEL